MNAFVAQAKSAWQVVQAEPALLVFGALVVMAVLLIVALIAMPTQQAKTQLPEAKPRPRVVRDLARRGKSPAEIARRTGLARDAIALAVSVSADPRRQSRPRAARTAGRPEKMAENRIPVFPSYPMSIQRVR